MTDHTGWLTVTPSFFAVCQAIEAGRECNRHSQVYTDAGHAIAELSREGWFFGTQPRTVYCPDHGPERR